MWQALDQLVREGKICYVGSSNFAAWDIALAQSVANARHFLGLTSEQSLYNLAVRTIELELIPAVRALGIGLIAFSALHAGMLTGALQQGSEDPRIPDLRNQLEAYEAFCREIGAQPNEVAIAWLLENPAVSTAVMGPRTLDELRASSGAVGLKLPAEAMERLDQIWPGPGEAPEAYAW